MDPILFALTLFLVSGSLVALEMKDLLSAVIAVGVVGLGLAIVFLLLGAPDIAITQVVVEVIVVTVLIRATGQTGREEPAGPRRDRWRVALGVLAIFAVLGFTIAAFAELPAFGSARFAPSVWYLERAADLTGASNVVTSILLDYRAYDTLGEATVILTAVVGVLAILRRTPTRRPRALEVPPPPPPESVERKAPREKVEATHG